MIAVIFEVWPAEGSRQTYLDLAAALKGELLAIDGFISVERFESLAEPGKLLSLSFWRDEAAVAAWRTQGHHRSTQGQGRGGVFDDYRLRIAGVVRDYGMTRRDEAPPDSRAWHEAGHGGMVVQPDHATFAESRRNKRQLTSTRRDVAALRGEPCQTQQERSSAAIGERSRPTDRGAGGGSPPAPTDAPE